MRTNPFYDAWLFLIGRTNDHEGSGVGLLLVIMFWALLLGSLWIAWRNSELYGLFGRAPQNGTFDPIQWALGEGAGGVTLRISGTRIVATANASMIARKASA